MTTSRIDPQTKRRKRLEARWRKVPALVLLIAAIHSCSSVYIHLQLYISVREGRLAGPPIPDTLADPTRLARGQLMVSIDQVVAKSHGDSLDSVTHFELLVDRAKVGLNSRF